MRNQTISFKRALKQALPLSALSLLRLMNQKAMGLSYVNKTDSLRSSILLAGVGRSGTTWVADMINYKNQYRYMFEPFHPHLSLWEGIPYVPYYHEGREDRLFYGRVKKILSGNVYHKRVDRYNRRKIYDRMLIKTIFANLFLKWIHVNFPDLPIVLLLRHPCAVAHSKMKFGKYWRGIDEFFRQEDLVRDYLEEFQDIRSLSTDFEKYILSWCIQYYVPLKEFTAKDIHIVFYEHFCCNPGREMGRLSDFLGIEIDASVKEAFNVPSAVSRKDSAIMKGKNKINAWQEHITKEETARASNILKRFGLDKIYSEDPMPNPSGAYEVMPGSQKEGEKRGGEL